VTKARRVAAIAAGIGCLLGMAVGAGAAPKPKGPEIVLGTGCSIVATSQIEESFGEPVLFLPVHGVGDFDCLYDVGVDATAPPGGRFMMIQEFPSYFEEGQPTARLAVEDRRAIDTLSEQETVDVDKLGITAYLNRTTGTIVVAATKKYAFSLQWDPAGRDGITKAERKKLIALAKDVVKRAPR
jgi:hypothetical protein